MARDWRSEVDVREPWKQFQEGLITIQVVAKKLAGELKENQFFSDRDVEDCVAQLMDFSENPSVDADDFDDVMEEVYSTADLHKRIWIRTV